MAAYRTTLQLLTVFCAAMVVCSASVQEAAPPEVKPGYEELFEAGRLLKSCPALDAATEPGATLFQKRMALSDKSVVRAFDLLRAWLERGVLPPGLVIDASSDGLTPALSGIRALARALYVKEYVLLADGRVREAIDVTRDGLRLAHSIQSHNLVAWLSGQAIQAIVVKGLSTHLEELSARDCDYLSQLAQDWTSSPDTLSLALERERQGTLLELRKAFADKGREGLRQLAQELQGEEDAGPNIAAQIEALPTRAVQELLAQTEAQINATFRKLQIMLRTPYWERGSLALPTEESAEPGARLAAQFTRLLLPVFEQVLDRQTRQQAVERLLGCHAVILRYRWEHDRLPVSLAELKLGEWALDPFNGQPFVYKPSGTTYRLESIGPMARDDNSRPVSGQHVPVTLTFGGR
ncbi:MAG TPA: hypothetical protein VFB21_22710 [Chthonomonadaceae bacterium]|nr:hypothetical protein [Chthonomonadaceae bacterium]